MLVFKRVTTPAEAEILRTIRNECKDYMTRSTEYITPEQQAEWFKTAFCHTFRRRSIPPYRRFDTRL